MSNETQFTYGWCDIHEVPYMKCLACGKMSCFQKGCSVCLHKMTEFQTLVKRHLYFIVVALHGTFPNGTPRLCDVKEESDHILVRTALSYAWDQDKNKRYIWGATVKPRHLGISTIT